MGSKLLDNLADYTSGADLRLRLPKVRLAFWRSLRLRLLFIMLFIALPLLALFVYTALEDRAQEYAIAEEQALRVAKAITLDQSQLIEGARELLATISALPAVYASSSDCSAFLARLLPVFPNYSNLGVAGLDGGVWCSAVALADQVSFADREWFSMTLRSGAFEVSDFVMGRTTNRPILNLSYPAFSEQGEVAGVVFANLDLSWFLRVISDDRLPEGATMTIIDGQGVVLARLPDPDVWVGHNVEHVPIVQTMLERRQSGTVEDVGLDGTHRLFSYMPLSAFTPHVMLSIGVPLDVAYAQANAKLKRNLLVLLLVALLVFGTLWLGTNHFVLGPVDKLVRLSERLRQGELSARSGLSYHEAELGLLAKSFDEMTAALQEQHERRAEAERELEQRAEELARYNAELQDFAYVASHDLQEPLRKIQAFGDRLSSKYGELLGVDGRQYLERMQSAAGRLQRLINELLAYSRVTTKAQPFSQVDLNVVVREVLEDLEARLESTGATVQVAALPVIEADPTQMRQLFQNLIANALKFQQEGRAPEVRVYAAQAGTHLQLCVADNGIGFDEKYLDRIFVPFQRLHGRGVYEGTGIGLAICRKIAERHGGSITARSAPGMGATFMVSVRVAQGRHDET